MLDDYEVCFFHCADNDIRLTFPC